MRMSPAAIALTAALSTFLATASVNVVHARVAPAAVAHPSTDARGVPSNAEGQAAPALPDGEGKAVVEKVCTQCHGLDYLVPSKRTVQEWRDIIDLMRAYGAEGTDDQWKAITGYIAVNLAFLNVNKGTAEEFALLFPLDEKAAQDVVAYREKQGGFKAAEDLKKAPGLDGARIDALGARLLFE